MYVLRSNRARAESHGKTRSARLLNLSVALMAVVLLAPVAQAGNLEDVIPGLYGGNGILLRQPPGNHSAQFSSPDNAEFNQIGAAIASGVNSFNVGAVVTQFTFDPAQAIFVQSDEGLGSSLADLADTIGKGNISIGTSYTRMDFKSFEGEDLNSLEVDFEHVDLCGNGSVGVDPNGTPIQGSLPSPINNFCFLNIANPAAVVPGTVLPSPNNPPFEVDSLSAILDIKISQEIFAFFANYGVLDNWDVGIAIPVVHSDISVSSFAFVNRVFPASANVHNFCTPADVVAANFGCEQPNRDLASDFRAEDAWGIGDIELRSKYQFLNDHEWAPDAAVLGRVRFPSGDEKDFLGTGFTSFYGALVLSKTISIFTPHANVGVEMTTGPHEFDNVRWVVGSTAKVHDRVTVATDFLGRHFWHGSGIGDDILEVGFSVKVNPFSSFNLIGTAVLPLNYNHGLRTAVTWGAGIEYTF